jgi:hypothetical protein
MAPIQPESRSLIQFITWYASRTGTGISKIRLIKFLYLADVHSFRLRRQTATPYRWSFYHYGPWTLEAQLDIEECVAQGVIQPQPFAPEEEAEEITLYRSVGADPNIYQQLGVSLESALKTEIDRWSRAPLNLFLNYVYFETAPMRYAKRGELLRFDPEVFAEEQTRAEEAPRRYSSRGARKAFQKLLTAGKTSSDHVPVPRDAIIDDAYVAALEALDAQDRLSGELGGVVEADPDSFT